MNRGAFSPPERLIYDVQGVIVELKKEYFSNKVPLNDDQTLVHKLCVRLENVLRYGAREKYTFVGVRKDYWSYINDCIPKDETVRFVQLNADVKTYQGKGRAFLRQALMEKSLADTLQRCSINERMTKEYYLTDSIFRNDQLLQNLVHSLYDLNAVDFHLPHQGYDLDRSFPSFARKSFGDKRSASVTSEQKLQEKIYRKDLPADPVIILNKNISAVINSVASWLEEPSTTLESNSDVSLQNAIDKVIILNESLLKIKTRTCNEIESLQQNVQRLKEENFKVVSESDLRIKQLNERFSNLQKIDSVSTNDKLKELSASLVASEMKLAEAERNNKVLEQESISLKKQVENLLETNESMKSEKDELVSSLAELKSEIALQKHHDHTSGCTNKIFESKISELQKTNDLLKSANKDLSEKAWEQESIIKAKEHELKSLKEAFEKSTGLVVGSFKELKDELSNQLKQKVDTLQNVSSANDDLLSRTKMLKTENDELKEKKKNLEASLLDIKLEKDNTISQLNLKVSQFETEHLDVLQFSQQLSGILKESDEIVDEADGLDNEDGLFKKKKKKRNQAEQFDYKLTLHEEQEAALRRVLEMQQEILDLRSERKETEKEIVGLKFELSSVAKAFKELQEQCEGSNLEKKSARQKSKEFEDEISKLNVEIDNYNSEIFNMSLEVSKLNEEAVLKDNENKRANSELEKLAKTVKGLQEEKYKLGLQEKTACNELTVVKSNIKELKQKFDVLSVENHALKGQLESQEAAKNSIEKDFGFSKKESENTLLIKNEELQSLKFQLSTEEMKKENALKELAEVRKTKEELVQQLREREEKLKDIESETLHHKTTLEVENETLAEENGRIHKEMAELKGKYGTSEKEITFLKVQLAKVAKEKEEEKAARVNGWNRLNNLIEEKKQSEENYRVQIKQLLEDIDELKSHLINLTKDKHELWTKKDQMEFELKQRAVERWVDDEEVKICTNCQETFSLTVRKHHCRLCGHIFCHKCSNRWVKTQHSKKKIRACDVCADLFLETHSGSDVVDGGSEKDSIISSDQMSITDESLDEYRKTLTSAPNEDDRTPPTSPIEDEDLFEILNPSEVSSSGSFGPSEQIQILPTDLTLGSIVPTVNDDASEETSTVTEKVELLIPAGLRSLLPVIIGNNKFELTWEFTSSPKDVGFGIAYKDDEDASDETIQTSVPLSRYISHKQSIHGRMRIERAGLYYLVFNNSYSRLTRKTVECSVGLRPYKG